jgi:23S rRNA (cytosine1962-C5)-methyltransferase
MKVIRLRAGKDRSLLRRHPWVFQGSVEKGKADPGETVRVESAEGKFLCWASFSPSSMIRVRAWSFDEHERIDEAFFQRKIEAALAVRARLPIASDSVRLFHGEADGLPGLIVDRYRDTLVAQFLSAGTERWKAVIADQLLAATGLSRLYERSDSGVRTLEGLDPVTGWLRGEGETAITIA